MSQPPKSTDRWTFDYDMERGVTTVTLPHWAFVLAAFLALSWPFLALFSLSH